MSVQEEEYKKWYSTRPLIIQQMLDKFPPDVYYKIKSTGSQCYIHSIEEPKSGLFEDITFTVYKTGKGGALDSMGLGELDTNGVFGLTQEDLEIWKD